MISSRRNAAKDARAIGAGAGQWPAIRARRRLAGEAIVTRSPPLRYEEPRLVEALSTLSPGRRTTFAAACAQRLMPVYKWVHARTGRGDPVLLDDSLSALWEDLKGALSDELDAVRARVEELIPDEDDEWIDEIAYAQHAASAVAYALRCRLSELPQDAAWAARQVYEAIDLWVTTRDNVDLNAPGVEDRILGDPLIQAELSRQSRDVAELGNETEEGLTSLTDRIRRRAEIERLYLFGEPLPGVTT
jgi:uncharacterized protein YjaG (DUF416 family)